MITKFPRPQAVSLELNAVDREELILELSGALKGCSAVTDLGTFREELLQRERDTPTGLEAGCALPHARSSHVTEIVLAVGRSRKPVDFGAHDGPARLFFLFGVPLRSISAYLKLVARLSSLLRDNKLRTQLIDAADEETFLSVLMNSAG